MATCSDHLEAFDELDDPCNPEQPQQLLYAQQLIDLHVMYVQM